MNEIERFLLDLSAGRGVTTIGPDDDLLATGMLDSYGLVELLLFLEQRYGIEVAGEDVTPERFATLRTIEAFIAGKRPEEG